MSSVDYFGAIGPDHRRSTSIDDIEPLTISSAGRLAERLRTLHLVTARGGLKLRARFARTLPAHRMGFASAGTASYRATGHTHRRSNDRSRYLCRLLRLWRKNRQRARPFAFRNRGAIGGMGAHIERLRLAPAFAFGRHDPRPRQRQIAGQRIHCPLRPDFNSSCLGAGRGGSTDALLAQPIPHAAARRGSR